MNNRLNQFFFETAIAGLINKGLIKTIGFPMPAIKPLFLRKVGVGLGSRLTSHEIRDLFSSSYFFGIRF